MTWFSFSANETEAAKAHCVKALAVDFDFPSAHSRFWSGIGEITVLGNPYLGVGNLGRISVTPEHVRLVSETKTFQLHGESLVPSWMLESDIDNCFGRTVTEYLLFLDPTTYQPVASPEINWEGRMGKVRRVDGLAPLIEVNAEHRLALIDKADGWRYTHEHQQQFFAGDLGFREMPSTEVTEILWGGFRVFPGGGNAGTGSGGRPPRRRN